MVSAWRIVKARYAANAFDGEGARRSGGRWNSPGTSVVYVLIECRIDPALVVPLQRAILPKNWQAYPAPAEARAVGDRWVKQGRSVALQVPSVVVPHEHNFLINPAHAKFPSVKILASTPFPFDPRLLRSK